MPYSSDAIANGFLAVAEYAGEPISPMKLQKLSYFAHGWHLAIEGNPFVNEPIQAWRYGPVIYSLYCEFKEFRNCEISRRARDVRNDDDGRVVAFEPTLVEEAGADDSRFPLALIDRIWEIYGEHSASRLSNMTHADGTPWKQIYDSFSGDIPNGITIPDDMIRSHFVAELDDE